VLNDDFKYSVSRRNLESDQEKSCAFRSNERITKGLTHFYEQFPESQRQANRRKSGSIYPRNYAIGGSRASEAREDIVLTSSVQLKVSRAFAAE
jgi:hypothetical protein